VLEPFGTSGPELDIRYQYWYRLAVPRPDVFAVLVIVVSIIAPSTLLRGFAALPELECIDLTGEVAAV
jgi:hypothetical protein